MSKFVNSDRPILGHSIAWSGGQEIVINQLGSFAALFGRAVS
jgi:hypothetical protein